MKCNAFKTKSYQNGEYEINGNGLGLDYRIPWCGMKPALKQGRAWWAAMALKFLFWTGWETLARGGVHKPYLHIVSKKDLIN